MGNFLVVLFLSEILVLCFVLSYLAFDAVTYLENNRAGITVFGFMLDRSWLHSIFGIQLALSLWLLNKTIGV